MEHTIKTFQPTVILYHNPCPDGFGSYVVARKFLGESCLYIPFDHNDEVPENFIKNENVMMIDCCYDDKKRLDTLLRLAKSVYILDHHEGNKKSLLKVLGEEQTDAISYFDTNKSGVHLAWEFFNGKQIGWGVVPAIVLYLEDRDLYKFQYDCTKSFCGYVDSLGFEFDKWVKLFNLRFGDRELDDLVKKGEGILAYFEKLAIDISKTAFKTKLPSNYGGHEIVVVNIGKPFNSEVPHILLKKYPTIPFVIAFVFEELRGQIKVRLSFRSRDDFDVIPIAQKFGGNGHPQAAGAIINVPLFFELLGQQASLLDLYSKLTHEKLIKYLIERGWSKEYENQGLIVFDKGSRNDTINYKSIYFATTLNYGDYNKRLNEAIVELAAIEQRSEASVLQDVMR
jgi:oligoribonuclease NrnB/cAMP/cGMP phosphodiesterase (DHH superfamily)